MTLIRPTRTAGLALALVAAALVVGRRPPRRRRGSPPPARSLPPAPRWCSRATAPGPRSPPGSPAARCRCRGVPPAPCVDAGDPGERGRGSATEPDVSIGPGGVVAVVWSGTPTGGVQRRPDLGRPAGQAFGAPAHRLRRHPAGPTSPQVEVGPAGVATVVWASRNTTNAVVRSKTASATSIGAPDASSPRSRARSPGVSLARNGDRRHRRRLAARGRSGRRPGRAAAGRCRRGSRLPAPVANAVLVPDRTTVAIDGAGNATLGWAQGATAESALPYAAAWPRAQGAPSGRWRSARRRDGRSTSPSNGSGRPAATWSSPTGLWYVDLGVGAPAPLTTVPVAAHDLALSETGAVSVAYAPAGAGLTIAHRLPGGAWTAVAGPVGCRLGAVGGRRTGATRRSPGPTAERAPCRHAPSTAAHPTAVHLTAPDARAQRGQADPGRLDRRRHLLADHLRGGAAGGDLPHPAVRGGDLADHHGDRRGVPGEAGPDRVPARARQRRGRQRRRVVGAALRERRGQRQDPEAEEAGGARGLEDGQEGQGAYSKDLTTTTRKGATADPPGGGPAGGPAGLHRSRARLGRGLASARTRSAPSPWRRRRGRRRWSSRSPCSPACARGSSRSPSPRTASRCGSTGCTPDPA